MYKCSECGQEFEIKPDYCDCGNDIFVEIKEEKKVKKQKIKKTFTERYPWFEDLKDSLDPLSVIIFFLCCILSICLVVFVKPVKKEIITETQPKQEVKSDIIVADVDSFWNNTPPKNVEKRITVISEKPITEIKEVQKPIKQDVKNIVSKTVSVKKTVKQSQPAVQTKKTNNIVKKQNNSNAKNNVVKNQQVKQTQPVKTQNTNITQQQKTSQQTLSQKVQVTTQNIKPINISNQEMKTYKNGLRNTITSKINFENIYGSGICEVTFTINQNGKLINRKFAKQSNDGTLNEEVYEAIMSTPKYQIPPTSYNGEILHYVVKMKNGSYSVVLY